MNDFEALSMKEGIKTMKKNLKVGLMAGLLITPAIVAQAGDAEASETQTPYNVAASVTAEGLLNSFKAANEESTSAILIQERDIYNTYKDDETFADIMPLINAKLTYLERYSQLKQNAAQVKTLISKLTNTNKSLVADRKAALEALENLNVILENASNDLSNAVGANADTFLETLLYYDENGQADFINKYVTGASLSQLQSFEDQTTAIEQFIESYISPVTTLTAQELINKESFINAVVDARTAFNEITDLAFKNVLKIQLAENNTGIEQYIKNAEADIKKAQTIEDKIKDLVENPPTATTFNSKVNALVKEYGHLTEVQKNW